MQERTDTPAVEHGITIEQITTPAGRPFRAACVCGWDSAVFESRTVAEVHGQAHDATMATTHAREVRERIEARNNADYPAAVADRVAKAVCESDPLTVDQLGEIADTLGTSASSLLPPHRTSPRTTVSTNPVLHGMRYPAVDAQGRIFDRLVPHGAGDPFIDECPPWCEIALTGDVHTTESCDEDRNHWGTMYSIPVRSVQPEPGHGDPDGDMIGTATLYLRRDTLHRDPQIWLGEGDTGTGLMLSLSEAEDIATLLTQLVRTAEAGR